MMKNLLLAFAVIAGLALACPTFMVVQQYMAPPDPYASQKKALEWEGAVKGAQRWDSVMDSAAGAAAFFFQLLPWVLLAVLIYWLIKRWLDGEAQRQDMLNRAVDGMFPVRETYVDSPLKRLLLLVSAQPIPKHLTNINTSGAIVTVGQPEIRQFLGATNAEDDLTLRSRMMLVQSQVGNQRKPTNAEVKAQIGAKGYTPWIEPQKALPGPVEGEEEYDGPAISGQWQDALAMAPDGCIPVGWNEEGYAYWNHKVKPHFALYGMSGTGKSLMVGLPLIMGWLHGGRPALVLDPEGGKDMSAVDQWALVAPLDSNDGQFNIGVWDRIQEEFDYREDYLKRAGVGNYLETELPPLGIFFEEFQEYYTSMVEYSPDVAAKITTVLGRVAKRGRKFGMSMVLWAQQPVDIPRAIDFQLSSLTLNQSTKAAQVMGVFPKATNLPRGKFLYEDEKYDSWRIVKFDGEPGGIQYGRQRINEEVIPILQGIPDCKAYFNDSPLAQIERLSAHSLTGIKAVPPSNDGAPAKKTFASLSAQKPIVVQPPAPPIVPLEPDYPSLPPLMEEYAPLPPPAIAFDGPWVALAEEWFRAHPDRVNNAKLEKGDVSALARLIFEASGGNYDDYPTESAAYNGKKSTAQEHLYALIDRMQYDQEYRNSLLS